MEVNSYVTYKNKKFGFSMTFPRWWKDHCFVDEGAGIEESEASLHFHLRYSRKYDGKSNCIIFAVLIFKMDKAEWKRNFEDSPINYLGYRHGRVFAWTAPEEPPEEFLKKNKEDYDRSIMEFRMLMRMENEELPRIVETFHFLD